MYLKALRIDPFNRTALNNYACVLLAEAQEELEQGNEEAATAHINDAHLLLSTCCNIAVCVVITQYIHRQ